MKYTIKLIRGGLFTRTYKQLNIIRYYECGGGLLFTKKSKLNSDRERGGRYLVSTLRDVDD